MLSKKNYHTSDQHLFVIVRSCGVLHFRCSSIGKGTAHFPSPTTVCPLVNSRRTKIRERETPIRLVLQLSSTCQTIPGTEPFAGLGHR